MAEAEELVSDAARHATVFVQRLWRRHRPLPKGPPTVTLADAAPRLDLLITAVTGTSYPIRIAQLPPIPTVLARLFRRAQHPWQSQAIPATDGKHLWLPADSGIEDIERGHEHYRIMALQQAIRAQRGSASFIDRTLSPLQADVYLLLEAWAVDETLVEMLPGMGSAVEHLRRQALRQRPLLTAFSPARQPLESLLRQLLASPCGRTLEDFPLSESPTHSQRLIDPVLSTLGLSPQDCSLGNAPLLRDCWTGHLFRPSSAGEGSANALPADGQTSTDTASTAAQRSLAQAPRYPQRRRGRGQTRRGSIHGAGR